MLLTFDFLNEELARNSWPVSFSLDYATCIMGTDQ